MIKLDGVEPVGIVKGYKPKVRRNAEPVYQLFQLEARANKFSGKPYVLVSFDSFSELMKYAKEYFRNGYTDIDIYIRGIYGRKSIKRNSP